MNAETVDLRALVNDDHDGPCCDCCDGYCDILEQAESWPFLISVEVGGVTYVGDRYHLVREDVCAEVPEDHAHKATTQPKWTVLPTVTPPLSDRLSTADMHDRRTNAGVTVRSDGTGDTQHLYLGDRHIGWTTVALERKGAVVAPDDMPEVRRIAGGANIGLNAAAKVLNLLPELAR